MSGLLHLAGLADATQAGWFALAVLVLNATPGADLLLTVTRTLQRGWRSGLAAAAGIAAGCAVHAGVAAFGLAALLALSARAFAAVQWAGAVYLVWLAWGLWRQALARGGPAGLPGTAATLSRWQDFRVGLLTNVLNPKVALFFLAFLPPFIDPATPDKTLACLLLGLWFVLQGGLFLAVVVLVAAQLRRQRWPDAVRRVVQALAGTLFLGLALRLALARPHAA